MATFVCQTDLGPPFPFKFPDSGLPVSFKGKYCSSGKVAGDGTFSCEILDPEIIDLLDKGKAEWFFESIDGRLSVQILA
jgi:hypothetical protein